MSSVQSVREFINERLSAAAAEIFGVIEQTIVQYEEEIDRQRKLLENSWKPAIQTRGAEFQEPHICKQEEDSFFEQQLCHQERMTNQNQEIQEPPEIKEDQEQLFATQDGEQLVLKQETDTFLETPSYEDIFHSEADNEQHVCQDFSFTGSQDETVSKHGDLISVKNAELMANGNVDHIPMLRIQQAVVPGKKPVSCDVCGKAFRDQYLMRRHHRVHTGEKPFTCETCGKSFRYSSHLSDHKRIHTGERLHVCTICGRSFTDQSRLRVHTSIHTGKKPYSCKICGKCFRQSGHLNIHLKIHTGEKPYHCPLCGKGFIQKSSMKSHMKIHTGEKRFPCEICGEAFEYPQLMLAHMKNEHMGVSVQLGNQS